MDNVFGVEFSTLDCGFELLRNGSFDLHFDANVFFFVVNIYLSQQNAQQPNERKKKEQTHLFIVLLRNGHVQLRGS